MLKLKPVFLIILLSLFMMSSCKKKSKLEGNYFSLNNGEYVEHYFKSDSMRVAAESEWVGLSDWKKIEIKNDTLFYETFGEWRDNGKALIEYVDNNQIKLITIDFDYTTLLKKIDSEINFKPTEEFWTGFKERKNFYKQN